MSKEREIKFRAWDKKVGEMFEVHELYLVDNSNNFGKGILDEHNDFHPMDEIELMQYTGFDINGKKIYEGDVVSISGQGNYEIEDICKDFDILVNAIVEGDLNEIVGNIYKNPELLEDKKQREYLVAINQESYLDL